jgi:hypothetical protein
MTNHRVEELDRQWGREISASEREISESAWDYILEPIPTAG